MNKIILILIVLFSTTYCKNDKENENQQKFFDAENLSKLDLAKIDVFWKNDSKIDTTFNGGDIFELRPGFIKGIFLFNKNDRSIRIAVFVAKDTAINAMEYRIKNVATIIEKGTSDKINGTWWYADDIWYSSVFVNKLNTIIEVKISRVSNEDVENILYNTANELARRIDNLSTEIKY
jgi:hypothetical protein